MVDRGSEQEIPAPRAISVRQLLEHREVAAISRLRTGEAGLARTITHPRIQKSGLVFAGHTRGVVPTRVQVLGETEMTFLEALDAEVRRDRVRALFELSPSVVVVTRGVEPLGELVEQAEESGTPLVVAEPRSSRTISTTHTALDELLAPRETIHGVLVDIHGLGTLLTGPSGIGKSECALFLVERGHRLVADDRVQLTLQPSEQVAGEPVPVLRHHLEVRGIGIVNVRDLFGATAVRDGTVVDLLIELCHWREEEEYERLGLDDESCELLGVRVPRLRIPVRPGRDMAVILEVAARNELLKRAGHHVARRFVDNLEGTPGNDESSRPRGDT